MPKGDEKKFNLTVKDAETAKFFDIIMGSDIIYDECVIPDLFDTGKCLKTWQHGNREQILTSPTI